LDPDRWQHQDTAPWPLHTEPLPHEHIDTCGLSPHGALLVRPDGHIGARWRTHPPDDLTLRQALDTLTKAGAGHGG
jgi:hypothetical protein